MTSNTIIKRVGIITGMLSVCFVIFICGWMDTHYIRQATVTRITNNVVTITDTTNNVWTCEATKLKVNDRIKVLMDNNGTDTNIYDDIIIKIKKY